jgi:lysophospholipase L1-like esterase
MRNRAVATLVGVLLCGSHAPAQSTGEAPASTADLERRVAAYRRVLSDWAGLTRYGSDNAEMRPPAPGENRVVFIGDQITEFWGRGAVPFFPGRPYVNRGIDGQTTPQMLVRFRQDVVALRPRVVVIQGGTNDVARVTGPATRGTLGDNLMSMSDVARANGIRVVLATIPPVCDCVADQTSTRPLMRIREMNGWIRDYAKESGTVLADYYSALAAGREMDKNLTTDGVLPNHAGYRIMELLAEKAIVEALSRAR